MGKQRKFQPYLAGATDYTSTVYKLSQPEAHYTLVPNHYSHSFITKIQINQPTKPFVKTSINMRFSAILLVVGVAVAVPQGS